MKTLLVLSALVLAPFHAPETGTATTTPAPHESVLAIARGLRRNDLRSAFLSSVGPQQYELFRAAWDAQRKAPIDAGRDARFRSTMALVTDPGAEDVLMGLLEPQLAELKAHMPEFVGTISSVAKARFQQAATMGADERRQAEQSIDALCKHLTQVDLSDPQAARKAVEIVCATARKLEVDSLADVQGLDFDHLVVKLGVVFGGLKSLLEVYGVSLDRSLDSFKAETIKLEGDHATVRYRFDFLGVQTTSEVELVRNGQTWLPQPKPAAQPRKVGRGK